MKGFGYADIDAETPMTADTLVHTASTGKAYAATLLTKLLAQHPK